MKSQMGGEKTFTPSKGFLVMERKKKCEKKKREKKFGTEKRYDVLF